MNLIFRWNCIFFVYFGFYLPNVISAVISINVSYIKVSKFTWSMHFKYFAQLFCDHHFRQMCQFEKIKIFYIQWDSNNLKTTCPVVEWWNYLDLLISICTLWNLDLLNLMDLLNLLDLMELLDFMDLLELLDLVYL